MINDPDRYLQTFKEAGADILTVHLEACPHLHRTIQGIKALGMKAGVAINPHTRVDQLSEIIADIDLVCMMSVNPGFGGQKFIENTYSKITFLSEIIRTKKSNALIEIDGGVDMNNYKKLIERGANVLVAGNTVFSSSDPSKTIADLKKI
jgi:ribulose-phosphate 3-epimerase